MKERLRPAHTPLLPGLAFICQLLAACLFLSTTAQAQSILLIPKGMMFPFWRIVCMGATDAAREEGVELIYRGPRVENKPDAQKYIFDLYLEKGIDAVVVAPSHVSALNGLIRRASKTGVKVVVIDSPPSTRDMASIVASDNYAAGALGAELLLKRTPAAGKLLLVGHIRGNASTDMREKGFLDYVAANAPKTKVTVAHLEDGTISSAISAVNAAFLETRHYDGIFAVCEMSSMGTLQALHYKPQHQAPFIALDYTEALAAALETGLVDALIVQSPYSIGYLGVKTAVQALKGEQVEKSISSPVMVLTRDNLEQMTKVHTFFCTDTDKNAYPSCFR